MKKLLVLLFSLFFLYSPSVFARNISFSCEAGAVAGDTKTLELMFYENTFPTIIINSQQKEVSYTYLRNGNKYEYNFKIFNEDKFHIIAFKDDNLPFLESIYFNKEDKTFSMIFAGMLGNTLSYGKCF